MAVLGPPSGGGEPTAAAAGLIDSVLVAGTKSGYGFTYTPVNSDVNGHYLGYTLSVALSARGPTDNAYYFTDQTYVIRVNNSAPVSGSDSPVGQ